MNGTEKQINWAEEIRNNALAELNLGLTKWQKRGNQRAIKDHHQAIANLQAITEAEAIINHRTDSPLSWKDAQLIDTDGRITVKLYY